jgi:hypothetical protein
MATILLSSEVKPECMQFEKSKPIKEGSVIKSARIGYRHNGSEDAGSMIIQTARMKTPFGIGNDAKFANGDKWDIRLSFQGEERSKKIQRFRHCMEDVNKKVVEAAGTHSTEWLGEQYDPGFLKVMFKSSIKKSKKENYADMFRISIPFNKDNTGPRSNVEFYDEEHNKIEWTEVTPGSEVVCLFVINGAWSASGTNQFGISVKLVQLQLFKAKQLRGYQIKAEPDYDDVSDEEAEADDKDSIEADDDEEVGEVDSEDE